MASGAEHFAMAEQLLLATDQLRATHLFKAALSSDAAAALSVTFSRAQVHATLALAQATLAVTEYADWDSPEPSEPSVED